MPKKSVDIHDVNDAVSRIVSPNNGDHIIVRALSIMVATPSFDMSITNATMQLLIDNFNDPNASKKYELDTLDDGRYEVVVVFHLRRVGDAEKPILN